MNTPCIYSKYDVHWDESICALLCTGQRVLCCELNINNRTAVSKRQAFRLLAAGDFFGAGNAREKLDFGFSRRA